MRIPLLLASIVAGGILVAVPTTAEASPARCVESGKSVRCYKVLSTKKSTFKTLFTDGLINNTRTPANLECSVSQTKTFSASLGYTVTGSVKVKLLADISVQASATVKASVSATRGSKISKRVPARTTIYCDRGAYTYRATVRRTGSNGQHAIATTTKTAVAPTAVVWRFRTQ